MSGVLAAFAMSYSFDCVETKISLTYCIYTYIYATALLLLCLCKSVGVLCYTAAMLLLCSCCVAVMLLLCCCCTVAMRLCCCCLSLKVFSFYALTFHGIDFAKLVYGWGLFR